MLAAPCLHLVDSRLWQPLRKRRPVSNERDPNFRKAIHSTTRLSAPSEADKRKQYRGRNTLRNWRNFRTSLASVPEALQSQNRKLVPLPELAKTLGVDVKRLLPALEAGYLKLVSAEPPLVYEPPPAAIEWLKLMFQPITLRPFLSTEMVAEIEGMSAYDVRRLLLDYNIPIYSDPVFGELMSIASFSRFHEQMHHHREPARFDRQALLRSMLAAADPERKQNLPVKAPRFSQRLEEEITRVSNLPEPHRTDAALRLWESYADARKVSECVAAAWGLTLEEWKEMKRLRRILEVELPPEVNQGSPVIP